MATAPVSPHISRLVSGYGVRPGRRSGAPTFHSGADFLGSRGDPVFAVADGIVDFVATDSRPRRTSGYGNVVSIFHPDEGVYSMYAHLSRLDVAEGDHVSAGQQIGDVGNTTNGKFRGMGTHLHFEIRRPGPGGRAPVPGPYRAYNMDPVAWLEARGVGFGPRGEIAPQPGAVAGLWSAIGLGGLGQYEELDLGAEGLPEEPTRDPWTFDPLPAWFLASVVLAGSASLIVGGYLLQRGTDWGRVFEGR